MAGIPLLPDDRLALEGSDLITHATSILNMFELEQDDVPRFRNTEVTGLDRGRPEEPAKGPRTLTMAGLIIGDVDLTMPTPNPYTYPKAGVRENWRALQTIFAQQFDAETLTAQWQRRDTSGSLETVWAEVQVGNWQITKAGTVDWLYTFELTRFSDWEESS